MWPLAKLAEKAGQIGSSVKTMANNMRQQEEEKPTQDNESPETIQGIIQRYRDFEVPILQKQFENWKQTEDQLNKFKELTNSKRQKYQMELKQIDLLGDPNPKTNKRQSKLKLLNKINKNFDINNCTTYDQFLEKLLKMLNDIIELSRKKYGPLVKENKQLKQQLLQQPDLQQVQNKDNFNSERQLLNKQIESLKEEKNYFRDQQIEIQLEKDKLEGDYKLKLEQQKQQLEQEIIQLNSVIQDKNNLLSDQKLIIDQLNNQLLNLDKENQQFKLQRHNYKRRFNEILQNLKQIGEIYKADMSNLKNAFQLLQNSYIPELLQNQPTDHHTDSKVDNTKIKALIKFYKKELSDLKELYQITKWQLEKSLGFKQQEFEGDLLKLFNFIIINNNQAVRIPIYDNQLVEQIDHIYKLTQEDKVHKQVDNQVDREVDRQVDNQFDQQGDKQIDNQIDNQQKLLVIQESLREYKEASKQLEIEKTRFQDLEFKYKEELNQINQLINDSSQQKVQYEDQIKQFEDKISNWMAKELNTNLQLKSLLQIQTDNNNTSQGQLRQDISFLNQDLDKVRKEKERLQNQFEQQNMRVEESEMQLMSQIQMMDEQYQYEIQQRENIIMNLNEQLTRISDLRLFKQQQEEQDQKQSENQDIKDELKRLQEQLEKSEYDLKLREDQIANLEGKISQIQSELDQQLSRYAELEQQQNKIEIQQDINQQIDIQNEQNEYLMELNQPQDLQSGQEEEQQSQTNELDTKIQEIQNSHKKEIDQKDFEIEEIKKEITQLRDFQQEGLKQNDEQIYIEDIQALKDKRIITNLTVDEIQKLRQSIEDIVQLYEPKLQEKIDILNQYELNYNNTQKEVQQLREELQNRQQQDEVILALEQKIHELEQQFHQKQLLHDDLTHQLNLKLEEYEEKFHQNNVQLEQDQEKIHDLTSQIQQLQVYLQKEEQQNQHSVDCIVDLEGKYEKALYETQQLSQELDKLRQVEKHLENKIMSLNQQIIQINEENANQIEVIKSNKLLLQQQQNQIEDQQRQQNAIIKIQEKYIQDINQIFNFENHLQLERLLNQLQQYKDIQNKEIDQLNTQIKTLQKQNIDNYNQQQEINNKINLQYQEAQKREQQAIQETSQLQAKYTEFIDKANIISQQNNKLEQRKKELETKCQELEKQVGTHSQDLKNKIQEIESLKGSLQDKNKLIQSLQTQQQQLQNEIKTLKEQNQIIITKNNEIQMLNKRLQKSDETIEQLTQAIQNYQIINESNVLKIEKLQQDYESSQKQQQEQPQEKIVMEQENPLIIELQKQLRKKEEQLVQYINEKEQISKDYQEQIKHLHNSQQNLVDKRIIRDFLLNYFDSKTPPKVRPQILDTLTFIINMDEQQREKIGLHIQKLQQMEVQMKKNEQKTLTDSFIGFLTQG
ncbi:hypothetical protein pb186bvf_001211 [Paramecium bursaria]